MTSRRRTTHGRAARQAGFTLIESLMAAGVLLVIVTAVSLAVSSGQQHGYWAQQRIAGTLAADALMCRIQATGYDDLSQWNNHREEPGQMVDVNGDPLPAAFAGIGRFVLVYEGTSLSPVGSVQIAGSTVVVRAFDTDNRPLVELRRFVPNPPPASLEGDELDSLDSLDSL